MISIPDLAEQLRTVLTTVATEAGRQSGCIKRQRCFDGAGLVQTLVFGWWQNPEASLGELAQVSASRGVAVSPQALAQRFTSELAACLAQVLDAVTSHLVRTEPVLVPVLERFAGVYVLDSSTLSLPNALAAQYSGCGGHGSGGQAALKLQVCLDLRGGSLTGPRLEAGRASDRASPLQHAALPPGSLRLADVGYFSGTVLRRIAAAGGYWLSRWQTNTGISDPDGQRWHDVAAALAARADPDTGLVDTPIRLGVRDHLPARLLAFPVSETEAARRRRQLRQRGRRNGYTPRACSLALAGWTVLVTNVEPTRLSIADAVVLLRARWQIELLFKRWKSQGGLARSRSQQPWRILCEIYAKLIGLVFAHRLLVAGCWSQAERSLVKADQLLQRSLTLIVLSFDQVSHLIATLRYITQAMSIGCRLERRRARPSTAQLLLDPSLVRLT